MGKSFSYGYKGSDEKTLALGIMGACAEVAFAKSQINTLMVLTLIVMLDIQTQICKTI